MAELGCGHSVKACVGGGPATGTRGGGGGPRRGQRSPGWGGAPSWSSCELPAAVEAGLWRRFPDVLSLPEEGLRAARDEWLHVTVVAKSLGRRIPAEWVAKEAASRSSIGYVPDLYPLADDLLALRLCSQEDRDRILAGGPWVVAGQLLAMEPWRPNFVPGPGAIKSTVVWLRLPRLPMEYWGTDALLAIAAVAGKPLAVDTFTKERRKMGYARVKVAIDVSLPLKPGVLLKGDGTDIWQAFVYESLPAFCFDCGRIGHDSVACPNRLPEVTEIGCSESRPPSSGPSTAFGPWLAAMRLRPMGAPNRPPPASRSAPLGVSSSPFPRPSPVGKCPAPPSSATGGWQKPAKVARRCSPVKASSVGSPVPAPSSSSFAPLASLGSAGEGVAPVLEGVLRPCPASLKRARSPVGRRARSSSGSKTSRPSPARAGRGTRASRGRTASVGPSMVAGRARGRSGPRIDTPGPCLVGHGEASSCSLPPLGAVPLGDLPGGAFRAGGPALLPGAVRPGALVDVAALSGGALEDGEVLAGDSGVSAGVCAAGEAAGASVAGSTAGDEFGGLLGVEALHQAAVGRVKAALALAGQAVSAGAEVLQSDGALPMEVSEESLPRAAQGVQPAEVYL